MTTITVPLAEELEEFVAVQVATEGFTSASDYVLALLQQARQAKERASLDAKLLAAHRSLQRGEGKPWTAEDFTRMRAELRKRYGDGEGDSP